MNIIERVKRWFNMRFLSQARQEFSIKPATSAATEHLINRCMNIYQGSPDWLSAEIKTVNFAQAICSEVARLTTMAIHIEVEGADEAGSRAEWMDKQINAIFFQLRHWVENGCAYGTIILKPTLDDVVVFTPDRFVITEEHNGQIRGIVFHSQVQSPNGEKYYNRLEYHRFNEDGSNKYAVDNRCFIGETSNDAGKPINIDLTPWAGMAEHIEIDNLEKPLFGVLRTPAANNVDANSSLGMPIFANAIEELKDLDIAYSRNAAEIKQSKRTVLMDADKLTSGGKPSPTSWAAKRQNMELPEFVNTVEGASDGSGFYREINPTLNTSMRLVGINNLLSQIGFKCGFANGYFVFNEKSGFATATQVEADQQRTVQLVKDMRDKLEDCINGLCYALDKMADLYDLAPVGEYEIKYDFGDILYSYEADKATWWNYVIQGKMPVWKYFEKFEGMTEEEAKALVAEANQTSAETQQLFAAVGNE